MKKRLIIIMAIVWAFLTVVLLTWANYTASAAPAVQPGQGRSVPLKAGVLNADQLRDSLYANPEVMLQFLNDHSEILLDIVQQGAVLRRNKSIVAGWQKDLSVPKSIAVNGRPMRGAANAPVTIVAFSDFTCAYCQQASSTVKRIMDQFGGKVRYVFKAFPRETHGIGRLSAEYFVAAGLQSPDKAWDLYDRLFQQRDGLMQSGEGVLKETAKAVGLDMKRLAADIKSKAVKDVIDEDLAEANRYGLEGTPTFFVNNLVVRGAVSEELFAKAVEMALEGASTRDGQTPRQ